MAQIKMHSMEEKGLTEIATVKSDKKKKYYPSVTLDDADYMSDFNVGDEIQMTVNGKVKGIRSDGKTLSYTIELNECGVKGLEKDEKDDGSNDFDDVHEKTEKREKYSQIVKDKEK